MPKYEWCTGNGEPKRSETSGEARRMQDIFGQSRRDQHDDHIGERRRSRTHGYGVQRRRQRETLAKAAAGLVGLRERRGRDRAAPGGPVIAQERPQNAGAILVRHAIGAHAQVGAPEERTEGAEQKENGYGLGDAHRVGVNIRQAALPSKVTRKEGSECAQRDGHSVSPLEGSATRLTGPFDWFLGEVQPVGSACPTFRRPSKRPGTCA